MVAKQGFYEMPKDGWVCFHCGERFTTPGAAKDHFGKRPEDMAACRIKVGEERGLVMDLRRYQSLADALQTALLGLQRGVDCWCEHSLGNPMYPRHTSFCEAAKVAAGQGRDIGALRVNDMVTREFVTFLSPGAFVNESTTIPITTWDTDLALDLAGCAVERHGAMPYCFFFTTRGRNDSDLDSSVIRRSGNYFLDCKVETLQEVEEALDREILADNMRCNGWGRVATTRTGHLWTAPFNPGDVNLEW